MKKYIIASMAGLLALTSCRLDDNINPNKPAATAIALNQRLAASQTSSYAVQAGRMNALGNLWMNTWTGNYYQYGNPATDEQNLTLHTGFYALIWSDMYRAVTRYQQIIDSDQAKNFPNHVAIAKIMKAYNMQYIVDLYGDVPYTEAFKEQALVTPKYDNDADVYKALVGELYDALNLINTTPSRPEFAVASTDDVMMRGSMANWKKFANTVLLKFAVRLSNTTDPAGVALRNDIIAKLSGAQYITSNVLIQPGYNTATAANQNPLYNWFGRATAAGGSNTGGYLLYRASDHAVKSLQGNDTKVTAGVSDPRISFLFATATEYCTKKTGVFSGIVQGSTKPVDDCADKTKRANGNFSGFGGIFAELNTIGSQADGVVMFLAESEFLQAEAAARGYAGFADAETHFINGIKASFAFDVETIKFIASKYSDSDSAKTTLLNRAAAIEAGRDAYITAITGKPKVGWSANMTDNIAAIQYQRWVALTNYNAVETYINYKRTGYPSTPLSLSTSKTTKPYRLVYPASEYSSNAANVPVMTGDDAFVLNSFTPFWYK